MLQSVFQKLSPSKRTIEVKRICAVNECEGTACASLLICLACNKGNKQNLRLGGIEYEVTETSDKFNITLGKFKREKIYLSPTVFMYVVK